MQIESEGKAEEIRRKIKEARDEKGISQREMARHLGLNPGSYNRMENGPGGLKIDLVFEVAKVLDMHPSELLGRYSDDFNRLWETFSSLSPERQQRLLAQAEDLYLAELAQSSQPQSPDE